MIYADPEEAGRLLGRWLSNRVPRPQVILGVFRSGVPVARIVARALGAELDYVAVARICERGTQHPIGAVDEDGLACLTAESTHGDLTPSLLGAATDAAAPRLDAIARHRGQGAIYEGRVVAVVDDGAATGSAMIVAIRFARRHGAREVVAALPVAAAGAIDRIEREADEVVALHVPDHFLGVDAYYDRRDRLTDGDVTALIPPV